MMTLTPSDVPPLEMGSRWGGGGDDADVNIDDDDVDGFIQNADGTDVPWADEDNGSGGSDDDGSQGLLPGGLRIDAYISREKLVKLTGVADLAEVSHLEMRVDTGVNTLGDLGTLVPNLRQLKLSHSKISTVRDLGTSLTGLNVLWLARVGLTELEGIGALPALRELYAPFNDVSDLSPLVACENLEAIDVEGNDIADLAQVHFLGSLGSLRSLTLEGNPVATVKGYRRSVTSLLPTLECLDDLDVDAAAAAGDDDGDRMGTGAGIGSSNGDNSDDKTSAAHPPDETNTNTNTNATITPPRTPSSRPALSDAAADFVLTSTPPPKPGAGDAELRMINDAIKYAKIDDDAAARDPQILTALATDASSNSLVRPQSAIPGRYGRSRSAANATGSRVPLSARGSSASLRLGRSSSGSLSGRGSGSGSSFGSALTARRAPGVESSSELTFGATSVFCGNAMRALRSREAERAAAAAESNGSGNATSSSSSSSSTDYPVYGGGSDGRRDRVGSGASDPDLGAGILDQLIAWKMQQRQQGTMLDDMHYSKELLEELDRELLDKVERVTVPPRPPGPPAGSGPRPRASRPSTASAVPSSSSSSSSRPSRPRPNPISTTAPAPPHVPRAPEAPLSGRLRPQAKRTIVRMRSESSSSSSSAEAEQQQQQQQQQI